MPALQDIKIIGIAPGIITLRAENQIDFQLKILNPFFNNSPFLFFKSQNFYPLPPKWLTHTD